MNCAISTLQMYDMSKNPLEIEDSKSIAIMTKIRYIIARPTSRFTASTQRT